MNWNIRHITLLIILLLSTIAGITFYFLEPRLLQNSPLNHPLTTEPSEVIIDKYGHYHFYANSSYDLYKTLGYFQAARYPVKMDLFQRTANGTLSEVFGSEYLDIDILSRTVGFADLASDFISEIDPDVYQILKAYCDGINEFIDRNTYRLPWKFKIRRYSMSHWKPEDCLAIQRLLAWSLSDQLIKKVVFYKLLEIYGPDKIRDGFPAVDNLPPGPFPINNTELFSDLNYLINGHLQLLDLLKIIPEDLENSWVLSAEHTVNNIPMMGAELPGFLNDYHDLVELNAPDINISGLIIPGLPFMQFGSNHLIAWNLTVRPADNLEFVLTPISDNYSGYGDSQTDFVLRQEQIIVRNAPDTTITVRETKFGPVIGQTPGVPDRPRAISIHWSGFQFSDDLKCYLQLYSTTNWNSFKDAVRLHIIPSAEVDFIDINGNIGTIQYLSDLETDQHTEHIQTLSRIYESDFASPIHHLFRNLNPLSGYIHHQQEFSEIFPDSRVNVNVFDADSLLSSNDLLSIDMDRQRQILLPLFAEIVSPADLKNSLQRQAYDVFTKRAFQSKTSGPAFALYSTFLKKLCERIYKDEMDLADSRLFSQFTNLTDEIFLNLICLLQQGESSWFDDIRTTTIVERRKTIVLSAFTEAVEFLAEHYSPNISQWAPENILSREAIERTRLSMSMTSRPVIDILSVKVRRSHLLGHEQVISRYKSQLTSWDRFNLIQDGGRILTIPSE